MREVQVFPRSSLRDMRQLLTLDRQSAAAPPQGQTVPEESDSGFRRLPEVIDAGRRDQHLGLERHLLGVLIADAVEDAPQVRGTPSFAPYRQSCLMERSLGQRSEKGDGIEQVGFAD